VSSEGDIKTINNADLDEAVAWKNGRLTFTNADLGAIMRQVKKWYNVEVVYSGKLPNRSFTADISRKTNLSQLLQVLELSNIHFKLEGKKLTVMP
jgi:ferric-dicitrate binding protein FerR (iron transport regulator)